MSYFVDSDDDYENEDSYLRGLTMLIAQQTQKLVGIIPAFLGRLMMLQYMGAQYRCMPSSGYRDQDVNDVISHAQSRRGAHVVHPQGQGTPWHLNGQARDTILS